MKGTGKMRHLCRKSARAMEIRDLKCADCELFQGGVLCSTCLREGVEVMAASPACISIQAKDPAIREMLNQ